MKKEGKSIKTTVFGIIVWSILALVLFASISLATAWYYIFKPNVKIETETFIYIPTGSTYEDVIDTLKSNNIVNNYSTFEFIAKKKSYHNKIKSGKYSIKPKLNNNNLVNLLRSGNQMPVYIQFNSIRTAEQLAGRIGGQIEADSLSIIQLLNDSSFIASRGFNFHHRISMFIPNTYEIWWDTSAEKLFDKMHSEYEKFWNEERLKKAENIGFSPLEVITLASIVDQETSKNDEKNRVAGVYLNRIRIGMPLQADPTLIYAAGDFSIRRVLNHHKEIDSPYNTYMYTGLPPGPICIPTISGIDAVLNAENHNYIFFCAREDFSGYHNFAVSYNEHLVNARRYQAELNRRNIRK
ncbi:MAG: endolytic transglycosylase MltG [Bacteroidales bacterium]|jgi:UPF0755 protein|nr:endolytic transglycosylase MltG [Bacteroidales bacterium]